MEPSTVAVELIVFDLDGTLVDSRRDIACSVNFMLEALRLPPLGVEEISEFVGRGVANLIRSVLGESHRGRFAKALRIFRDHYSKHLLDHTVLYPDVRPLLESLEDIPKSVITNKPTEYAVQILAGLGVNQYFAEILGGDQSEAKKPAPDALLALIRRFGVEPDRVLMVGDSTIDIETGKNAGVWTCAVSYGFGSREDLIRARADYLLDRLIDLKLIVQGRR